MKLFELTIDDNVDEVFAISLVESPAIESDWVYFKNEKEEIRFAAVDNDQHMLIGAILIPDKRILRVDGEGEPYQVFFTKDTVKQLAQNYLMKKYTDKATLEHEKDIKGVSLVESWIKDSPLDKSNKYGLNLPVGSWVGMFKITDPKIWNDYIKTGKVKGFSIEGLFSHKLIQASMLEDLLLSKEITELSDVEANKVLNKLKYLIRSDKRYKSKKRMDVQDMEGANPTISSSYPGQAAAGYVAPATLNPATIGEPRKMKKKMFASKTIKKLFEN
jgi:hypothetical protein